MIICSSNNIDFIQGVIAYGNEPSITDWRIANSNGVFNVFNSKSSLGNLSILENVKKIECDCRLIYDKLTDKYLLKIPYIVKCNEILKEKRKVYQDDHIQSEIQGAETRLSHLQEDFSAILQKIESCDTELLHLADQIKKSNYELDNVYKFYFRFLKREKN